MSKRLLAMRRETVRPVFSSGRPLMEGLEGRQLMSVGPSSIAGASVNDSVFDANTNTVHVVYYDATAKSLKYQSFDDNGGASAVVTVDASGNVGQFVSLAEDQNGVLHTAYYDGVNGDLKYARREVNGAWTVQTVVSKNTQGLYPSICIDTIANAPVISYYNKTAGDLMLARMDGGTWTLSTIASGGDVGRYSSLAYNLNNYGLGVAFEDTTDGHFCYAEQAGAGWKMSEVDTATRSGGGYISMNYNNGMPAFSYYDAFNADLKYAQRSARGRWAISTVASSNSQGLYTDLAWTFDTNQPAIVYYNKTADSVMLAYRRLDLSWGFETEATGGGRNVTASDAPSDGVSTPALYLVYTDTASAGLHVRTI
jgi:hypothetical protein